MAFCIATHDLPRIHDYKDAEYTYGTIKPIRGNEHIRPLGKRSDHAKRIECNTDKNGRPYYAAILHSTEVVSYYEDGTICVKTGGWTTQSTTAFIDRVSPWGCWQQYGFVNIRVSGGSYAVRSEGTLIKDGIVQNPIPLEVHKYNRAETKRIRELAKPLFDYFRVMQKVIGNDNVEAACYRMRQEFGDRSILLSDLIRRKATGGSVDDKELATLFAWCNGYLLPESLYEAALFANVTNRGRLYITTPLPPGVIKRGMTISTEAA